MAEKKAVPSKKEQFTDAVYDLGLTLIERYLKGAYSAGDGRAILDTVVEIFKSVQKEGEKRD